MAKDKIPTIVSQPVIWTSGKKREKKSPGLTGDSDGIDVPPTAEWNVPGVAEWNEPPVAQWNVPPVAEWNVPVLAGVGVVAFEVGQ